MVCQVQGKFQMNSCLTCKYNQIPCQFSWRHIFYETAFSFFRDCFSIYLLVLHVCGGTMSLMSLLIKEALTLVMFSFIGAPGSNKTKLNAPRNWAWPGRVSTHWDRDKIVAILQKTFWNAFSWMKMYEFRWSSLSRFELTIFQHNGLAPTRRQAIVWTNDI